MIQRKTKIIHLIGLMVILVILLLGAVYIYKKDVQQKTTETEKQITWKTYRNTDYHFEIKYPEGWEVSMPYNQYFVIKENGNKKASNEMLYPNYNPELIIKTSATTHKDISTYFKDYDDSTRFEEGVVLGSPKIIRSFDVNATSGIWAEGCGEGNAYQGPMVIKNNILYDIRVPAPCIDATDTEQVENLLEYAKTDLRYRPIFDQMIESFTFIK